MPKPPTAALAMTQEAQVSVEADWVEAQLQGVPPGVSPGPLEVWAARLRLSDEGWSERVADWERRHWWAHEVWIDSKCWEQSGGAQTVYGPWPKLPRPREAKHPEWCVPVMSPPVLWACKAEPTAADMAASRIRVRRFRVTYRTVRLLAHEMTRRERIEWQRFGITPEPRCVLAWEECG